MFKSKKIEISYALLSFLVYALLSIAYLYNLYNSTTSNRRDELMNYAWSLSENVSEKFKYIDEKGSEVLSIVTSKDFDDTPIEKNRVEIINNMLSNYVSSANNVVAFNIFNKNGDLLYSSISPLPKINVQDRGYFKKIKNNSSLGVVYSEPIISRTTKKPTLIVAKAVLSGNGEFMGTIQAYVDLNNFDSLFANIEKNDGLSIRLRSVKDSYLLAAYPSDVKNNQPLDKPLPNHKPAVELEHGINNLTIQGYDFVDGKIKDISFYKVRNFPFYIEILKTNNDILNNFKIMLIIALFGGFCYAALLIIIYKIIKKNHGEVSNIKRKLEIDNLTKINFITNMSHEIRTPLNNIVGFAELLFNEIKDLNQSEYVNRIKDSAKDLIRLVDDISDFSKTEIDELKIKENKFNLGEILKDLEMSYGLLCAKKSLNFELKISASVMNTYIGDSVRIRQVLSNLLNNAVKYTDNGVVRLSVELSQEQLISNVRRLVQFKITDSGVGFDTSILGAPSIGETNFNKKMSPSRSHGLGIGLAISNRLVSLMGGNIEYSSKPGVGTEVTFEVNLGVVNDSKTVLEVLKSEPMTIQKDHPANFKNINAENINNSLTAVSSLKIRVLVVEDNLVNQMLIKTMLNNLGFETVEAGNGLEAINILKANANFNLILMDIQMPIMDGLEATKEIRTTLMIKNIPIVAITSHASDDERAKCIDVGMQELIPKPIDHATFTRIVDSFIYKKKIST